MPAYRPDVRTDATEPDASYYSEQENDQSLVRR